MKSALEVWMDADFMCEQLRVGTLHNDNGQLRFEYEKSWLNHPAAFALDPDLSLDKAPFFPRPEIGNFGIFLDSSPDRWGQTLLKRREALQAKDKGEKPRNLDAWDFLVGVQDVTRQGAFRFKLSGSNVFLDFHALAAPPLTSLGEMSRMAMQLTEKRIDDLDALKKWLAVLVAPGASLGGARPKANFTQPDGSLWIAKFAARDDDRDIGAWEGVMHSLAAAVGIDVPPAQTTRFGEGFHTFCLKRFDRKADRRVFYASAMTLLNKAQSEGCSYLEMALFIKRSGVPGRIAGDLDQLFRRVVFNVAMGNRDDHLRNHGFLLTANGWRLSPAFDVNPSTSNAEHVLNIDDSDNRPDLKTVLATSAFYDLAPTAAKQIVDDITGKLAGWQTAARQAGISNADIAQTAGAFSALNAWIDSTGEPPTIV
ncbi:MAG: type II toxin-antitoxin system HipA family toxin [Polaromonas sp.]|nr:type II toxin-antitoxin system HipA family toxin [Polaromonas sp.]